MKQLQLPGRAEFPLTELDSLFLLMIKHICPWTMIGLLSSSLAASHFPGFSDLSELLLTFFVCVVCVASFLSIFILHPPPTALRPLLSSHDIKH